MKLKKYKPISRSTGIAGVVAACVACCAFPVVGIIGSSAGLVALTNWFDADLLWKILAWGVPVVLLSLGYYLRKRKGPHCDVSSCRSGSTDTNPEPGTGV